MTAQEFLSHTKQRCLDAGVVCLFPDTPRVSYMDSGTLVSGYFADTPTPTLACALGKPEQEWLKILVHESCHMDQWYESDPVWNAQHAKNISADEGLDQWLSGTDFPLEDATYFVRTMQAVEANCEARTIQKITTMALPIAPERYIREANSYLYFYSILLKTRQWYVVPPYEIEEIVSRMPTELLPPEEYVQVSNELVELFTTHCYTTKNSAN